MGRILGALATSFFPLAGLVAIFLVWLRSCRHGAYFGVAGDQAFSLLRAWSPFFWFGSGAVAMGRILGAMATMVFSSCGLGRQFCGLAQGTVAMGRILGALATRVSSFCGLGRHFRGLATVEKTRSGRRKDGGSL
ncbi:hypothetical protein LI177_04135 [bacterium 210820-DFI.6.37]|nr:hypothetical protein [bacterium 210820-DFI.6.37]